ncbi:O-antigen ligase family protein [Bermanella sp. R86510]|uniref:O-antigen ligase family protein n=1 Tax=unclassified Bermanella TaxID=2627862 RepID=UPI0037C7B434
MTLITSVSSIAEKINPIALGYALLINLFMAATPWDRLFAETIFFLFSITAVFHLVSQRFYSEYLAPKLPSRLKTLIIIIAIIPVVSILSFYTSIFDLDMSLLEPDSRWLLFIPIIIACYRTSIPKELLILALMVYCISAFIKALCEVDFGERLYVRVRGDENANPFGMYNAAISLMLFGTLLTGIYKEYQKKTKYLLYTAAGVATLLGVSATLLTGTRTAIILLVAGLVLSLVMSSSKKMVGVTVLLAAIVLTITALSPIGEKLQDRIAEVPAHLTNFFTTDKDRAKLTSVGQRLEQWKGGICVFTHHPILGTGPRSAKEAFGFYSNEKHCDLSLQVKPGPRQLHSMYFNTLATLGLLGVAIYLAFFTSLIKTVWNAYKSTNIVTQTGSVILAFYVLGLLVNGIGLDMWFRNYMVNKNLMALLIPLLIIFIKPHNTTHRYAK